LLILPVFLLGRRLYGAHAGWIAAALTALSPLLIHWSAHMLTESLFILCYVSAAALGWRAMTEQRCHLFFLAGFVCALAYLTRVIGLTLLPVLVIWMMIVARRQRATIRSTAVFLVAMGLGFLVLAGPYWISLYRELGQWTIAGSYGSVANVLALAGSSDLAVWERTDGRGESIGLVQKMSANLSTYIGVLTATFSVGLLFAIAAVFPPARTKGGTWYLLTVIAAYVTALLLSIAVPLPGERIRYSSPLAPLMMVLAAGGIARLAHLAARAASRVTAGAAGVLVVSLAIQPLYLPGLYFAPLWKDTPPSRHQIFGVWIRDHLPHPLAIMARKPYVPYYADAVWFMTPTTIDGVLELARTKHVEYLILDRGTDPGLRPELAFLLDPDRAPNSLQLVASQKIENGPVIVALYRIKTT
jgi:4-amino-4-deoxy-L-arabinose transferase-like glycosyltransferase